MVKVRVPGGVHLVLADLHRRLHDKPAPLVAGLGVLGERLLMAAVGRQTPGEDDTTVTATAVVISMRTPYQRRAAAGDPSAQATLNNSAYWAGVHSALREMAKPSWPANTEHIRHNAYVTTRAAQHPSEVENVPFELSRGRRIDSAAVARELAVIGAIINTPGRVEKFRFTPSSPDSSPYWLQPQDFGDPLTTEIWNALVTGPDPAIALPAASDPRLTTEQRATAMIQHITTRLAYNDHHRSTASPEAKARLDANAHQTIATLLARATAPDYSSPTPTTRPNTLSPSSSSRAFPPPSRIWQATSATTVWPIPPWTRWPSNSASSSTPWINLPSALTKHPAPLPATALPTRSPNQHPITLRGRVMPPGPWSGAS